MRHTAGSDARIPDAQTMANIKIDFSKKVREMKPMHGVNNGPVTFNFSRDATEYFKEAGIPYSRLHDSEYPFGSGEFVDIPCIFKNFDLDENDPANYNFTSTDLYLQAILNADAKIIYRLGPSIEHNPVKLHVYPPKDYLKWAKICEHLIMHVNEGWANGHHMGIEYWELWAEPDLGPKLWAGSVEEFAEFYTVTSSYLKNRFPNLKIGGPAFTTAENDFIRRWFELITADGKHPPLDFYTWHCYTPNVERIANIVVRGRNILDEFGYNTTENICDEWNYVYSWEDLKGNYDFIHSYKAAAFNAAIMAGLQNTDCSKLTYYDAQLKMENSWCGLFKTKHTDFHSANGVTPQKPYYAFKAFNEVYKCKNQSELCCDDNRVYAVAAYDGEKGAILASSYTDPHCDETLESKELSFDLSGIGEMKAELYISDENRTLYRTASFTVKDSFKILLPAYGFALIKLSK